MRPAKQRNRLQEKVGHLPGVKNFFKQVVAYDFVWNDLCNAFGDAGGCIR